MKLIYDLALRQRGEKFAYSDVGFLVLEEVVRRTSGEELDTFTHDNVFEPLGMHETTFRPQDALRDRAAPTELREGGWMIGDVHDPRAWKLGGVAGNAGLFSTASDLARFARALLGDGELDGVRVLEAKTVRELMAPHDVPGAVRALGWDVKSAYSANRGGSLSTRAVGHGGYTGTSLWIDPAKDLFVIVLSNRVHPDGHGSVNALAGQIASIAGDVVAPEESARRPACAPTRAVETGIDVLRAEDFARLRGAHVGLITNATGRARDGATTIALLRDAPGVSLVALFAPEHGLGASREGLIADDHDDVSGLPVYSLYGGSLRPSAESLRGIDTLVFDIQDVGTRFYTYASTMHRAMRTAAEAGLRFVVLDRPNPIDGLRVEGPVLSPEAAAKGFVNHFPLPVRHGMTIGELALLIDADEHLGLALDVIPMRGWRRSATYDETGLPGPTRRRTSGARTKSSCTRASGSWKDRTCRWGGGPTRRSRSWGRRGSTAGRSRPRSPPSDSPACASKRPTSPRRRAPTTASPCHGVRIAIDDRDSFEAVRTGLAIARSAGVALPDRLARRRPEQARPERGDRRRGPGGCAAGRARAARRRRRGRVAHEARQVSALPIGAVRAAQRAPRERFGRGRAVASPKERRVIAARAERSPYVRSEDGRGGLTREGKERG